MLTQALKKEVSVSCHCGTIGCNGSKCNSLEYDAALHTRALQIALRKAEILPMDIWAEFLRNAAADAGVMTMENFLGSVKKYEQIFADTVKQLEKATHEI